MLALTSLPLVFPSSLGRDSHPRLPMASLQYRTVPTNKARQGLPVTHRNSALDRVFALHEGGVTK